ncbi:MAG: hypothetical protein GYA14_09915 [Ignavibacteria bacterium]|nr:hypothetical protein [Ignavibacteria bacterium]
MKRTIFTLVFLLIGFSVINSQSLSIGPQVAYVKTSDAAKGVFMPAGAVRLNLGGLAIEGSIGYKTEEFANGVVKATTYPIMATAMLKLLPLIHVEAGLGWYNTKIEYSGILASMPSETQKEVGYHAGAGVELDLGSAIITGDLRYVKMGELKDLKINNDLKSDFIAIYGGLMFKL